MKWVMAFSAIFALGFTIIGYREWQNSRKLAAAGESTVGRVVHQYYETSSSGRRSSRRFYNRTYYVVVAFQTANKQPRVEEARVSQDVYDLSKAGEVQVHYLPGKPQVVQAGPKVEIRRRRLILGLILLGLFGGAWVLLTAGQGHQGRIQLRE